MHKKTLIEEESNVLKNNQNCKVSQNCRRKNNRQLCAIIPFTAFSSNTPLKIKRAGKVIKIDSKYALRGLKFDTEIAQT